MKFVTFFQTIALSCLTLAASMAPALAADDIVYSARYYNRPGTPGKSHYHLYTINADGTGRRQITRGNRDDIAPQWSPDGKQVLFVRRDESTSRDTLALVNAAGGRVKSLRTFSSTSLDYYGWSPKGDAIAVACLYSNPPDTRLLPVVVLLDKSGRTTRVFRNAFAFSWSPDGSRLLIRGDNDRVYEGRSSGKLIMLPETAMWMDRQTLIELSNFNSEAASYGTKHHWVNQLTFDAEGETRSPKVELKSEKMPEAEDIESRGTLVSRRPQSRQTFVIAYDNSDSTISPLFKFYLADQKSGAMKLVVDGQFLAWAPDGQRFATSPGKELRDYAQPINGRKRLVWTAPLQIGAGTSGKFKNIVSGLVHVVGADWR